MRLALPAPIERLALATLLIASLCPGTSLAWNRDGDRVTHSGYQSNPLVLPSGILVYSDAESDRIGVTMARPYESYWGPQLGWSPFRVYQGGGRAAPPRAVDYAENSVLIVWSDDRNGVRNRDVFVQRVGRGAIWPSFIWDGIAVCTADSAQVDPCVADDGAGGFYVAWTDGRNAGTGSDIYVQHYYEYGGAWDGWPANGIRLCGAAGNQVEPAMYPDGAGGIVVVWRDRRSGDSDLYAKGIRPDGGVDAWWGDDGLPVCVAVGEQGRHVVLPDGDGGAYVAWVDGRSTAAAPAIVRIQSDGQTALGWTPNGAVFPDPFEFIESVAMCRADSGGVFLAWHWLGTKAGAGTRVQRLRADGSSAWLTSSHQISLAPVFGTPPAILPDGQGGAFVAWSDFNPYEGASIDVRAARVTASGDLAEHWPFGGVVVSGASGDQVLPAWRSGGSPGGPIVPDGFGGFILYWTDNRVRADLDLYAQRVTRNGVPAPETPIPCFECRSQPTFVRRVYPNPTRGSVSMTAWVPEDRVALVDVVDVRGRVRSTQRVANLPGGTFMDIPVSLNGLPSGVYYVRYRLEGTAPNLAYGTRRVVLIR